MSTFQVSPYVNFQGQAREALEFYHKVLGGTLELHAVNEQGVPSPAGPEDRITYGRLEADGARIIGADGHPNYPATVGENMAIALEGTDTDRISQMFNTLAEGGVVKMPLRAQPWGATVGWLTDRFGINWQVMIAKA